MMAATVNRPLMVEPSRRIRPSNTARPPRTISRTPAPVTIPGRAPVGGPAGGGGGYCWAMRSSFFRPGPWRRIGALVGGGPGIMRSPEPRVNRTELSPVGHGPKRASAQQREHEERLGEVIRHDHREVAVADRADEPPPSDQRIAREEQSGAGDREGRVPAIPVRTPDGGDRAHAHRPDRREVQRDRYQEGAPAGFAHSARDPQEQRQPDGQ